MTLALEILIILGLCAFLFPSIRRRLKGSALVIAGAIFVTLTVIVLSQ